MDADLKKLRIDRNPPPESSSSWATRWIIIGVILFLLAGAGWVAYSQFNAPLEVEIGRVAAATSASPSERLALNATAISSPHTRFRSRRRWLVESPGLGRQG